MARPLISFIIPAFNSQEHLNECVTSITNQVFNQTNYEIIIINDASKNGHVHTWSSKHYFNLYIF